jgi:G3E family GTPase
LAGFLGSGKTTLLTRLLKQAEHDGVKAAVVMNELGDVNLDGIEVDSSVPMKEMLSGCICCTVRGDLGMELLRLVDEHQPDVVFVECTGAANPMELLDGVTEASLLLRAELKGIVTVMDAALLLEQSEKGKGQTYRLMQDQLRAASLIVLNKIDLTTVEQLRASKELIASWNNHSPIVESIRCDFDLNAVSKMTAVQEKDHDPSDHSHHTNHNRGHEHSHNHDTDHHHTHNHVMVYTHYMDKPIDSERFERWMSDLPQNVYRAKGILTFTDTSARFMFQYAYRQLDFMKIMPQREVPDVAVFIGEHFDAEQLKSKLEEL